MSNVARTLRPGARVLVRDYAEGDLAEQRLETKRSGAARKLGPSYYIRGDGTFCHYFSEESLGGAFGAAGGGRFACEAMHVSAREIENRRQGVTMSRRWIQAEFTFQVGEEAENSDSKDDGAEATWHPEWLPQATDAEAAGMQRLFSEGNQSVDAANHPSEGVDMLPETRVMVGEGAPPAVVRAIDRVHMHTDARTGLQIWDGGLGLSRLLLRADFSNQFSNDAQETWTAVELGAGCSPLPALALARAGASRVVATDGNPEALAWLRANVAANVEAWGSGDRIAVQQLAWGDEAAAAALREGTSEGAGFDAVVAADVLYVREAIPALFRTAAALLKPGGGGKGKGGFVICYTPRRGGIEDDVAVAAAAVRLVAAPAPRGEVGATLRVLRFVHAGDR